MKRQEAIAIYATIRNIKNGNISKESLVKYVLLRLKLKGITEEFEKVRQEISEETKPEGWKDGDDTKKWDEAFRPVIEKWLSEEVEVDTKVFTEEDCAELIVANPDRDGLFADMVFEYMKQ